MLEAPAPSTLIRPQPRVSRAATEADPILTRVALGRADDGNQFGMLLQVYADGTVIDGEGIHRLGPEAIRPLMLLLENGDLSRVGGHCGGPPTDFVEQIFVVVYERRLGTLRANSFSYSGNTSGCDPSVRQLHTVIEQLQARLSGSGDTTTADNGTTSRPTEPSDAFGTSARNSLGATPPPPLVPAEGGSPALRLSPSGN